MMIKSNYLIKVCLALTIIFINISLAVAQQDFIVTFKNDTIKGEITEGSLGGPKFIASGDTKKKSIRVREVQEYFIYASNKVMVAQILPGYNDYVFLERIENGRIKLFELDMNAIYYNSNSNYSLMSSKQQIYWYVSKDGAPIKTIKTNNLINLSKDKRKNELYELLKDNEEVGQRFLEKDKFSFEEIRRLISLYNDSTVRK